MITKEASERMRILQFWSRHGLKATREAFKVGRSSLYAWRKLFREGNGSLASLNPGSQVRHKQQYRAINPSLVTELRRLRTAVCPNLGKDKCKPFLDQFCKQHRLKPISVSTIGRVIQDKKIYHHRQKVSHFGKVKVAKKQKKLRKPKEFKPVNPGDFVEVDTVVRFIWDLKRYVITAVDTSTRYAFAWSYTRPTSENAKDFFKKLETVFPYRILHVQTDNGSEFHRYFAQHLKQRKTIHYWNYPGKPYRNGHVEKYNRTIQEEFVDWNETLLENPDEFNQKLMKYLLWYNTKRPHWGLKLQSPVDYMLTHNHLSRMRWTDTLP